MDLDRLLPLKVYKILAKKSTEELCLMTLTINAKFEKKLICCFKNDKNLVNFDPSTQKSLYTLIGPFHEKYVMFDLKNYRVVIFYETRE